MKLKKIIQNLLIIFVLAFSFLQIYAPVFAQQATPTPGLDSTNFRIPCPTVFCTLEDLINAAAGLIRPIFVITFIAMLIYGAWIWLTSQGDDKKIGTAKKIITAAIIGFALAVFAPFIVQVVSNLLGIQSAFTL